MKPGKGKMEYKILICDDEKLHRDILVEHIEGYFAGRTDKYEIMQVSSGEEVIAYDRIDIVDMAFLDIELGDMEGIDLSKRLNEVNDEALIVFVTSHPDYMDQAFEQFAFNYMVKPIDDKRFRKVMDRASDVLKEIKNQEPEKFYTVTEGDNMTSVPYSDIVFIWKEGNYLIMELENRKLKLRGTFRKLEEEIDMDFFLKCHKGYVVNKERIIHKDGDFLVLRGHGKDIPIGDKYRKNVFKEISRIKKGRKS